MLEKMLLEISSMVVGAARLQNKLINFNKLLVVVRAARQKTNSLLFLTTISSLLSVGEHS